MNPFKTSFLSCLAITLWTATLPSVAAGFDCGKAKTQVEKAICANPELSKLDETMMMDYKTALSKGNADKIKAEQKDWLSYRNLCENDKDGIYSSREACLKEKYTERLAELNQLIYLPQKLKTCTDLMIVNKATRLEGAVAGETGGEVFLELEHNTGFYILYVAGLPKNENADKYMFSTTDFNKGDRMKVCLVEIPKNCPKNDDRGKQYSVTNYKNNKSFVGTPDWHSCGGA